MATGYCNLMFSKQRLCVNTASYRAVRVTKQQGQLQIDLAQLPLPDVCDQGQVRLRVHYSSINFKDVMSCQGNPAVTRRFPHTPGIDAAGVVVQSNDPSYPVGAEVLVCCRAMGMNHPGGFAEYVQVPSSWLEPKPQGFSLRDCMVLGTAGFTAALAVDALVQHAKQCTTKPWSAYQVAVTGVTGGVGAMAALMLSHLGMHVTALVRASTISQINLQQAGAVLPNLGVQAWQDRDAVAAASLQNLASSCYDAVIDVAGGALLAALIKQLQPHGIALATGMVADTQLPLNVLPFILRGVTLKGINAESTPDDARAALWQRLRQHYLPADLTPFYQQVTLTQLPALLRQLQQGERSDAPFAGRVVVNCLDAKGTADV